MIATKNVTAECQSDWDFARDISRTAQRDANSPYAGKFVGIYQRQVVGSAETPQELQMELQRSGFDCDAVMVIDAKVNHDRTFHIGACRR